jgi:hypothetical protein
MKLFGWLDTTESDAFAREVAEEFVRNYPVTPAVRTPSELEKRLRDATSVLGNRAAKFNRETPLGWYRRARFMNTIKLCLEESGHSTELADGVVYKTVLRLAR